MIPPISICYACRHLPSGRLTPKGNQCDCICHDVADVTGQLLAALQQTETSLELARKDGFSLGHYNQQAADAVKEAFVALYAAMDAALDPQAEQEKEQEKEQGRQPEPGPEPENIVRISDFREKLAKAKAKAPKS